eukprot:CAMPEP_0171121272 /NCGR_PEP_ID=MMETSP0766_2-20121228/101995_1 /TAXON_ID=439317 /ORGANISM="Gambierdiscus australes, Strain CAWD 149" /LENGTH=364 /DNA_ID=CAMNT_0011584047 /DNA_START=108 /DNA_END=1202 /DNA_ORIENTATION=+
MTPEDFDDLEREEDEVEAAEAKLKALAIKPKTRTAASIMSYGRTWDQVQDPSTQADIKQCYEQQDSKCMKAAKFKRNQKTWKDLEESFVGPRVKELDVLAEYEKLRAIEGGGTQKALANQAATLPFASALQLVQKLIRGYMADEFQKELWKVYSRVYPTTPVCVDPVRDLKWVKAQAEVCRLVQYPVLKEYGFEVSPQGVKASKEAFTPEVMKHPLIEKKKDLLKYLTDPKMQLDVASDKIKPPRGVPQSWWKCPNPVDRPDDPVAIWLVVGGRSKGGIVVRSDRSLNSQQLTQRLKTNALVEQVEKHGRRIKYQLMDLGSGPEVGWVSVRKGGKSLLLPWEQEAESVMTDTDGAGQTDSDGAA